jgi:DsbC/DsbD-like thiol-disulfide interchange protein
VRDVTAPLASTLLAAALLLAPAAAQAAASPWSENGPSRVRLVTPWQTAPAAGELRLGLHFRTDPGWHVYWKNSGDAGYAPTVRFTEAPGLTQPELLWPAPNRFDLPGGLVAFGYEGEVVYPLRARLESTANRLQITADVDYLVCEVDCIPYRSTLTLTQPLGPPAPDPATAPLVDAWWARVPRPAGDASGVWTETVLEPGQGKAVLEVRLHGLQADPRTADLFLESHELVDAGRPAARALADGIAFRVPLTPRVVGKDPPPGTVFAWTATGLNPGSGGSSLEARQPALDGDAAAAGDSGAPAAGDEIRGGLPTALLQALLGGLLLALNPGTLAVLLAAACAWRAAPRSAAGPLGTLGTLGTFGTFGAFGAMLAGAWALMFGVGSRGGWPLDEPAATAGLAALALLVAVALWGLIPWPRPEAGAVPALLAGGTAALLALAWPAPPLARALDLARQDGPAALATAALAGALGLALPWLALAGLLASSTALQRRLPSSPEGARRLRETLGFLAAGCTVWSLYQLSRQISAEGLAFVQLALVAAALLAWLLRRPRRATAAALLAAGLAAALLAAPWLADRSRAAAAPSVSTGVPERPSTRNQ